MLLGNNWKWRTARGKWSQPFQAPLDGPEGERLAWGTVAAKEGYRFVHVHLYTIDGKWWVDAEMEEL